jgi:hypothetical protein
MSFDAHLLSLQTLFTPDGLEATFELRLGDETFVADVRGGRLAIERGGATAPDAVIEGDVGELLAVVHGRLALADTDLRITGDREAAERFMTLFPLPEPAPVPAA